MSKLLSFLGGAGEGFLEGVEKAEKNAKEEALLRVKRLTETYQKVKEENGKLTNSLKAEEDWIRTTYSTATPEQIAFLQGSPAALQALKAMPDPTKINLSDVIAIDANNPSKAVVKDRITDMPKIAEEVGAATRRGLAGFYDQFAEQAGKGAEMRAARAAGVDVQTMEAMKPLERPTVAGTFNRAALREQPGSISEIVKSLEVERFQIGQTFGKDSDKYKQADLKLKEAQGEIVKSDTKLEDRRDRLELQLRDTKDPAVVAALTKEINGINADIKARREATSTKSEREGKGDDKIKYANAKTRMEDYMNTDMTMNKGLGWRKYVEEKVVKDPATGNTIVIPGKKVGLTPEQEKEYIDGMNAARMQGLKDLGLVTEKGQPINNEVKSLMTAYGLNRPVTAPTPTPAPTTPAAAPAAAPAAQPAKVVSRATVQAQADKNKVTFEVAAEEARKQGYTIR